MYMCTYIHIHLLISVHTPAISPIMFSVLVRVCVCVCVCVYTRERSPTGNRICSFCVDENIEADFALPKNRTIWLLPVYSKSH